MPWPLPSTVPHLFLSNLQPSEPEVDLILNIISEVKLYMGHITKQLEIHPQYRVLKNQLRTYENYLIRHQSILSPLRRFPPELLCYIFEFFAPSRSYINTPDNHSRWSELPWSLSQVCHRWRGISLSMPLLWTKIPLLVPLMRHTIDPSFLQFYTGFLLRSADQPIDVFVTVSSYGDKIYTEIKWHPAIAILVSHSYRWQHLSIVSRSSTHVLRAFRRIKKRLSTLRTLSLELNREAYLDIFQKAPKLLQVRLIGISPERITLPWKQLVHYKGMYDQADATIPLHSGRSLETLELQRYSYVGSLERVQSLPIVLHNLVGLKLCKISEDVTTHLLRRLIIPVIEEIAIFDVADPDRDFDDPIPLTPLLTSMISCSTTACVLQRLSLGESSYHPGELIALLRLTPCLVFFDVKFPPLDDLVHLSVIDSIGGSSLIVPLLHTLVITSDWSYKDHTTAAVMNQLARKRCRETIGPPINTGASEPPHLLQTSFTVPLRIFRMDFPTGVSRFEAQGVLNGWPCETCEHCLEERLFVDWGSELQTLFPHLIPRGVTFIPSDSFKKSMELLTSVQKIMAFNKAMLNHKLQEVKHLFKFRVLLYLDHLSHLRTPSPIVEEISVEEIRNQASSVLQIWRRQVILGFSDHHRWVKAVGLANTLRYIPTCELDIMTPEAVMNAVICGVSFGTEEVRERSELSPLPSRYNELPYVFMY